MIESLSAVASLLRSLIKPVTDFFQTERRINLDHDIAVFRKLDAIANEPRLDDILNARIYNSRFRIEDHRALADLIDALRRIENVFLHNKVKSKANQLAVEFDQLLVCVMRTFFSIPNGYLKFYPDLIDRDHYDAEWKDVTQKLDKAWTAYKDFRLAVKENLKV